LTDAVRQLKKRDPRLADVIDRVGPCRLESRAQGLTALVHSVIAQQLSNSSAGAIRSRLDSLFGNDGIDPERLARVSDEDLRKTGLSRMKVSCLRSLADHVLTGKIDFHQLETMDDEAIIRLLTQVKGIGRWTAEMYLIFALNRLDVFPVDDFAVRTAVARLYGLPEAGLHANAINIAERWRPFRTIACWYLYRYVALSRNPGK